jgi:hypothetical protein
MPLRFFKNNKGKFIDLTATSGIQNKKGWWSSITGGDFDNDGDIDYVAGNVGLNSFFKASEERPVTIYGGDFNKDDAYDAIPSVYLPDKKGIFKEFPVNVWDEMVQQLTSVRKSFNSYKAYGSAGVHEIVPGLKDGLVLNANYFSSSFIENMGNGKFEISPLPALAQQAPIYGMVVEDVNEDGNLDLILTGNDYGNEVVNGHYDAMNGLVLLGNGQKSFMPLTIAQSGIFIPGDGKGLVQIKVGKSYGLAATQNKGFLKIFSMPAGKKMVHFKHDDVTAVIHLVNGKRRKHEIYYGNSFLSQSSRSVIAGNAVQKIEVTDLKGSKRTVF